MGNFWTPERVETLRTQWAENIPVRLIADNIGGSKNQVIGKARRLNLPMHADSFHHPDYQRTPDKPQRWRTRTTPRSRKVAKVVKLRPTPPSAPTALEIAFMDLEPNHCRYAITREHPHLFCGVTKEGDSPYCAFHHALCHEKPRGREDRARKPFLNPFRRAA